MDLGLICQNLYGQVMPTAVLCNMTHMCFSSEPAGEPTPPPPPRDGQGGWLDKGGGGNAGKAVFWRTETQDIALMCRIEPQRIMTMMMVFFADCVPNVPMAYLNVAFAI